MSRKISKEEFLNRFFINYPNANIELLNYTAISKDLDLKCNKCGKIYKYIKAREALVNFNCCIDNQRKVDRILNFYKDNLEWSFVKQLNKDQCIIHHDRCGNDLIRQIGAIMDNPYACSFCKTYKKNNMISIEEPQKQIDIIFQDTIKILDYNGQLEKNHYKCLKCGLIFTQQHTGLLRSRGCPKCDRFHSRGKQIIKKLLEKNNINFKEQVKIEQLPLQHFDFGVYNQNNEILYYIEVQGEQHFEEREIFRDSLKKIQERDNRKRNYCKQNDIPLYELIYKKGKFLNLDILPF